LQEREFERLGGTSAEKADVRFVAATHRNLEQMVKRGQPSAKTSSTGSTSFPS
jgi:transcriptional regulator with PAS, ATPase and Fis domain